ncbi:glycoside hydrolase superfamily [Gloeopeniophorella convolvens]|nr:glycoside hydrolase superfamily [Gloeopeniophorella convolvens]
MSCSRVSCFLALLSLLALAYPCLSFPLVSPSDSNRSPRTFTYSESESITGVPQAANSAASAPLGAQGPSPSPGTPILFLPQGPSPIPPTHDSALGSTGLGPASSPSGSVIGPNATHSSTNTPTAPLMMAYYPSWVADAFPPENIDLSLFDWIDFAFAVPDQNFALDWDGSDSAPEILARLVPLAHSQGKKVKLSIGGWDGSKWFSPAVMNEVSRQTFVNNIVATYQQYDLDGIDIDWEYPSQQGHPQNYVDSGDTANFLEFLKQLRASLPPTARITAAVQTEPFAGNNGEPMYDVRAFASVLDWVLIMNYDVWGASANPGPNAPLNDACRNSTQPVASADAAIKAWTAAGFALSQLVLGVPSYGYISHSSATRLRQRDGGAYAPGPVVHAVTDDGEDSGQVQFRELVRQGLLCKDPNGPGVYTGCGGFTRQWDACSSTPFLLSGAGNQVITYDDVQSLGLKAEFAKQHGLLGVNMFDLHGDTDQWELVGTLRQGLGL